MPSGSNGAHEMADERSWDLNGERNKLYGRKWRKARAAFLSGNPWCCMCKEAGIMRAATVVDHVTPHRGDHGLFWNTGNWQSLCQQHHNREKALMEIRGYSTRLGADGWPLDPEHPANSGQAEVSGKSRPDDIKAIRVPVYLVVGCPGSGKTTWAMSNASAHDVVIDFDQIDKRLNGRARRKNGLITPILKERNRMLLKASSMTEGCVFLTMMGMRLQDREWWRVKLGNVTVILVDTPIEVCAARVKADGERRQVADKLLSIVDQWQRDFEPAKIDVRVPGIGSGGAFDHGNKGVRTAAGEHKTYLVSDQDIENTHDYGFV